MGLWAAWRNRRMLIPLLTVGLVLGQPKQPPPPATEDIIEEPRYWLLGKERSSSPVRMAHVVALLGQPYRFTMRRWVTCEYYRCGVWFRWETPVLYLCPAKPFGPRVLALLRAWPPGWTRPYVR